MGCQIHKNFLLNKRCLLGVHSVHWKTYTQLKIESIHTYKTSKLNWFAVAINSFAPEKGFVNGEGVGESLT